MREHVLLQYATRRPYAERPALPEQAKYDTVAGYWRMGNTALVSTEEFAKGCITKKCDQETGEDQKGE